MIDRWSKLVRDARGATAIEYGLIVSLIVIAVVGSLSLTGGSSGSMWGSMTAKIVAVQP